MARYSSERKEAILGKLLPPLNMTIAEVSREENISVKTLYTWRDNAKKEGQPVPGKKASPNEWSSESKLAVVAEAMTLSESELSQHCREKGLLVEQVRQWKQACLTGFQDNDSQIKMVKQQSKADKIEINSLKKELRRKEKALAETAALLVLRKKLDAFWGDDSEES